MSGVNVRNLEKIQNKWLLFQRFVTSIVGYLYYTQKTCKVTVVLKKDLIVFCGGGGGSGGA